MISPAIASANWGRGTGTATKSLSMYSPQRWVTARTPMLRPLTVDLEELSMILEGDPLHGGGRIDPLTGQVWPQSAAEYGVEVGEIDEDKGGPDRWLWVDSEGSRRGYRDMECFIADLDRPRRR